MGVFFDCNDVCYNNRKEWKGPCENISRKTNPFRKTERGNSLYELYYCFFISASQSLQ